MNFDTIIDRRGTGSLKWENVKNQAGKADVIPLWVADMDFAPPREALAALRSRVEHKIFGYTNAPKEYYEALASWYGERYETAISLESVVLGPGLIPTLGIAVRSLTEKGEGVLVMPPVYYPFFSIVRDNDRVVVEAPLSRGADGAYEMDLDGADKAVSEAEARGVRTRAVLFCSPHNPGGRVWSREELAALLDFAARRGLTVVSDEIHGDIVCGPRRFVSLAGFPAHEERIVVLSAPNKTFNLAGLHLSHFVAPGALLRQAIKRGISAAGFHHPNVLSVTAALASYARGGPWLDALIGYLRDNMAFAVSFVNERIPGAVARFPEGTYLIWADVSRLIAKAGLADDLDLAQRLEEEGRVKLTAGSIFGAGGKGFVRINAASPRAMLSEGLERFAVWAAGL